MKSVFSQKPCDNCNAEQQIGNPYRWQCECDRCTKIGQWRNEAIRRLSEIEDILGDEYDLNRLKEAVLRQKEYEQFMERWEDTVKIAGAIHDIGVNRLVELAQADREERCVVLPCKPSNVTVYQLRSKKHARGRGVSPCHVGCAVVWAGGHYALEHQEDGPCWDRDFGETWFLTPEAAEKALEEMEENENG